MPRPWLSDDRQMTDAATAYAFIVLSGACSEYASGLTERYYQACVAVPSRRRRTGPAARLAPSDPASGGTPRQVEGSIGRIITPDQGRQPGELQGCRGAACRQ